MIPHICLRKDSPPDEDFKKLMNSTGINVIWHGPAINGMLQVEAAGIGIQCLTIEIGAAGLINTDNVKAGQAACENVMKILGMIKGVAKIPRFQIVLESNEEWIRSSTGGIFKPDIHLGQMVRVGQKIQQ